MSSNSAIHGGIASISDESGMTPPPCKTEILFRIWRRGAESSVLPSNDQAANQPGVVSFIEDVVASRRGVLVAADKNLYASILDDPSQALVVARQVQLGMEEFQKKSKIKPVAISIAIDANDLSAPPLHAQTDPGDPSQGWLASEKNSELALASSRPVSHDLLTLIRMSKPAQVLLTHELFQKVNLFRGLPLKAFQGRFGVFEYLWAAEEKLIHLQSGESLFGDSVEIPISQADRNTFTHAQSHSLSEAAELPDFAFHRTVASQNEPQRNPKFLALIASLLVVVLAGGIAVLSRGKKTDAPPNPTNNVVTPVNPAAQPKVQPSRAPLPNHPKAHADPIKAGEKAPPKPRAIAKETPAATDDEEPAATPVPSAKEQCQLPGSLQEYLDEAEHYRASGDYKGAERLFTKILVCDPTNGRAKTGLFRAKSAQ